MLRALWPSVVYSLASCRLLSGLLPPALWPPVVSSLASCAPALAPPAACSGVFSLKAPSFFPFFQRLHMVVERNFVKTNKL